MSEETGAGPPDSGASQNQNLEGVSILTWTTQQVQIWLKKEEFSDWTKCLVKMNGKKLAAAKQESFLQKFGEDPYNQTSDLFQAVEKLLRKQQKKNLFEDCDEYESIMDTRGTPVQSAAAPANDAAARANDDQHVFVVECEFPHGVHSTFGARRSIYSLLEQSQKAWVKPNSEYVWYSKDNGSDPKLWPLHVEVYANTLEGVKQVEQMIRRFSMSGVAHCEFRYRETTLKNIKIDSWHDLRLSCCGDYKPNASGSACQDDGASTGKISGTVLTFRSPIVTFQAITSLDEWFPPEKLHLIPRWLVNDPTRLADFPLQFWELAEEKFGLNYGDVKDVLDLHAAGQYNLNDDSVNFLAGHHAFHEVFDGLSGERVTISGTDRNKVAKYVKVGPAKLVVSAGPGDITEGSNCADAPEEEKRAQVNLRIEFFRSVDFDKGKKMIPNSTVGQNLVLFKTIRVTNWRVFLVALNFKATLNLASHQRNISGE